MIFGLGCLIRIGTFICADIKKGCFGCCIASTNPVVVDLYGESQLLDRYWPEREHLPN
jgi:hypothetical protein